MSNTHHGELIGPGDSRGALLPPQGELDVPSPPRNSSRAAMEEITRRVAAKEADIGGRIQPYERREIAQDVFREFGTLCQNENAAN